MKVMRKVTVFVAGLLGSALISFAENPPALPPPAPPTPVTLPTPPPTPPPAQPAPASGTVYVPDLSHQTDPLKPGNLEWNNMMEAVEVPADSLKAEFLFTFTNVSDKPFAITTVHPSCGCTTAKIPALPWVIQPSGTGEIPITVNIAGKTGMVFKTVYIGTERGNQTLTLRINIQPPVVHKLTEAERMQGVAMAKADRQAIFKGDCASCHIKNIQGKYSKDLYEAVCGICHEAENRATMVPNLHDLKVPTNVDFWQTWITFGKPGTLMPAFAGSQGGPLTDVQIASLAAYLNSIIPSKVPPMAH